MIVRQNTIYIEDINEENSLQIGENKEIYKDAIFFDLEHYVYKKPICVGVFGACYYCHQDKTLEVTQYMIENKSESINILSLAEEYFKEMNEKKGKKYIVTFSGNNDFTIINYLFQKYNVKYVIAHHYEHLDLQRLYEKEYKKNIGLKALEKEFGIIRESDLISGQNLAKTFSRIMKDKDYIKRMPDEKKEKILLYNEQDVVSLFQMCINWTKFLYEKNLLKDNVEIVEEKVLNEEENEDEYVNKIEELEEEFEETFE